MENSIDILNELKELSPIIAGMEKINVFKVPDEYFEHLSDDIMMGIKTESGIKDHVSANTSIADVPEGYFGSLADNVLAKIKSLTTEDAAAELRILSPMLYSIQNQNVFDVPDGYFEGLSEDVLTKLQPQQQKVIVMRKRSNTFLKYAVAAAFTGVMALGVFKFTSNSKDNNDPVIAQGIQIAKENKFDEELAKVTDADIVKFLEANGSDVKSALVANSVDENELPAQEDYLLDDKALDKYLNSINVNELKN